jgi:glycosidase
MGWGDCSVECNRDNYDTIGRYLGRFGLDGQADFVLYHAVPYRSFASDEHGMLHVDYWTQQSQLQYPAGAIMTPYIGSHDTARFVTLASYRGQDGAHAGDVPGRQWDQVAGPPPDAEAYARHKTALAWLYTLPGAPLLYYGDEYAAWGGADPNNRRDFTVEKDRSAAEADVAQLAVRLGAARRDLRALRRGAYVPLHATESELVFARVAAADVAVVALSKGASPTSLTVTLPPALGLRAGTLLHDRLGGADRSVANNATLTIELPSHGAAILAP